MALRVLATPQYDNLGSMNAVTGNIATLADGDTLTSPLSSLLNVICTPTTSVVVTPTFSGQTITFKVASGTPTVAVTILGKG